MDKEPTSPPSDEFKRELARDLNDAFEVTQFFLVYQPTIDLQTSAFAGVEALLRWRHPRHGVLAPDAFIDVLDASGRIAEVSRWALATACAQGSAWHDKGYRFAVSVNVSSRQFALASFVSDVANALNESRFDPSLLVLEFSQSTLAREEAKATKKLDDLKQLGVRISVDDFVPGSSTFETLDSLGVDIVKLARPFVADLLSSVNSITLVHELVRQSDAHHVQVIASGVEDAEQRERLANENVHAGQGYFFSEPHEASEIDRFLEDFAIFSGKPL